MSKNKIETYSAFEVFDNPQTTSDLWDELNVELNPNSYFFRYNQGETYKTRLLGPFVGALRFYVAPLAPIIDHPELDLERLAFCQPEAINKARSIMESRGIRVNKSAKNIDNTAPSLVDYNMSSGLNRNHTIYTNLNVQRNQLSREVSYSPHNTKEHELNAFLNNLESKTNSAFQKCIMVNGYIRSNSDNKKIKIVTLTKQMCQEICTKTKHNDIINGLYANDIIFSRKGMGIGTKFEIKIEPINHLNKEEVEHILSVGLIDIPSLINEVNSRKILKSLLYYYKTTTSYKMPKEFTSEIFKDLKATEENEHLHQIEEVINDLPKEAFEHCNVHNNPISSLEI